MQVVANNRSLPDIAFMEMTKMVPTLLRHFDVELVYPDVPLVEKNLYVYTQPLPLLLNVIDLVARSFFVIQTGLIVRLKPRVPGQQDDQADADAKE